MSELVRQETDLSTKMEYAKAMSSSNLLPKSYQGSPANLLFALEYAQALGVEPIHAITSIHIISGKPTASADLMAATVRRAGHKLRVTGDDTYAEATLIRADDPDFQFTARWDIAKAKQANLNTPTWKNYPGAMLRSRAITEVIRAGAPDAMFGLIYTPEELGAVVDQDGKPVDTRKAPVPNGNPPVPEYQQQHSSRIQQAMNRNQPIHDPVVEPEVLEEQPPFDVDEAITYAEGDEAKLRHIYAQASAAGASPEDLERIRAAVR